MELIAVCWGHFHLKEEKKSLSGETNHSNHVLTISPHPYISNSFIHPHSTLVLHPSLMVFLLLIDLVCRPEPAVDQFWEELGFVATIKVALATGRPEKRHLCIILIKIINKW